MREKLGVVSTPFYWIADIPSAIGDWAEQRFQSKDKVLRENEALKAELLITQRKLQQMFAVRAENQRLQQLMNVAEERQERVMVAELIGVSSDPLVHKVIINKGSQHGVYLGQPLVDADGLMGQVVEVSPYSSQVLLITDATHALQIEVDRNGVRAVAEGTGNLYQLALRYVANSVDIREGDLLLSSGLDELFPPGLVVGVVDKVIHDPGQQYATILARPQAQLDRNRHALLVFSGDHAPVD